MAFEAAVSAGMAAVSLAAWALTGAAGLALLLLGLFDGEEDK